MIDNGLAETSHCCTLPKPVVHRVTGTGGAQRFHRTVKYPVGTRSHCDECGKVWVVIEVMGGRQPGGGYSGGGLVWNPEAGWQRRKRLGLRWWQRRLP